VGVDVELPRRAVDHAAVARRVLAAAEADRIAAIADPLVRERTFLQAWVRWEAVLKCRGTGIGAAATAPAGPEPWVADLDVPPPGAAALAVERGPTSVRSWRWPPASA
ncbi:MAG TPA: 4'-phosphopantetheinyl transferase superfamily protein, partial [Conexibacter sp.]|nr:4'-phosphopantetheinyl transferase superfamily protein [Conexibacter sp.]